MKKLIKRLEIIKSGIELEDDDIIRHQLPYLKSETQDPVLVFIVMAIEQENSPKLWMRLQPGWEASKGSYSGRILNWPLASLN